MVTTNLLFQIKIRPTTKEDLPWLRQHLIDEWEGEPVVSNQRSYFPTGLPGFLAVMESAAGSEVAGEVTYSIENLDCEIVTLSSLREGLGIGSALFACVEQAARAQQCRRLQLVTTTDNLRAIGFYQKRGMRVVRVLPDAMDDVRRVKPGIPLVGMNGIALQDALLLEKELL